MHKKFEEAFRLMLDKDKPVYVANKLSNALNSFSFSATKAVSYVLSYDSDVKEMVLEIALAWLKVLKVQNENHRFDERNKASVERGSILISFPPILSLIDNHKNDWANEIANEMSKDHRTIQQTFSRFIFSFINTYFTDNAEFQSCISESKLMGFSWWLVPMI